MILEVRVNLSNGIVHPNKVKNMQMWLYSFYEWCASTSILNGSAYETVPAITTGRQFAASGDNIEWLKYQFF